MDDLISRQVRKCYLYITYAIQNIVITLRIQTYSDVHIPFPDSFISQHIEETLKYATLSVILGIWFYYRNGFPSYGSLAELVSNLHATFNICKGYGIIAFTINRIVYLFAVFLGNVKINPSGSYVVSKVRMGEFVYAVNDCIRILSSVLARLFPFFLFLLL